MPRLPDLPAENLADATPHLRRPFAPEAIRWKVQSTWGPSKDGPKTGGMVVPYVDARLVAERLDAVVAGDWEEHTEAVPGNASAMICRLTVCGKTRTGVGESGHSLKAADSDALKRAGVKFGIAALIYAMNRVILNGSDGSMQGSGAKARPTLKQVQRKGKHTLELTDEAEAWLREMYGRWVGKQNFGPILDHGDTVETLGLEGADQRVPEEAEPADSDDAVIALQHLYEEKAPPRSPARAKLGKGKFNAQLRAAAEDPDALAELRKTVEAL